MKATLLHSDHITLASAYDDDDGSRPLRKSKPSEDEFSLPFLSLLYNSLDMCVQTAAVLCRQPPSLLTIFSHSLFPSFETRNEKERERERHDN